MCVCNMICRKNHQKLRQYIHSENHFSFSYELWNGIILYLQFMLKYYFKFHYSTYLYCAYYAILFVMFYLTSQNGHKTFINLLKILYNKIVWVWMKVKISDKKISSKCLVLIFLKIWLIQRVYIVVYKFWNRNPSLEFRFIQEFLCSLEYILC